MDRMINFGLHTHSKNWFLPLPHSHLSHIVGCIHILEIVLFPSPPELIFVTHATHGLSVIFFAEFKKNPEERKKYCFGLRLYNIS